MTSRTRTTLLIVSAAFAVPIVLGLAGRGLRAVALVAEQAGQELAVPEPRRIAEAHDDRAA